MAQSDVGHILSQVTYELVRSDCQESHNFVNIVKVVNVFDFSDEPECFHRAFTLQSQ